MSSTLIKNVKTANLNDEVNILIVDNIIKSISKEESVADTIIDAKNLVATSGLVDMHVHLRDPGLTHKEDIITGCLSASAGGVTSILAMPNTSPCTDNAEVVSYILEKAKNATARVYVAGAITHGLKSEQMTDFEMLKNAGIIALTDDGRPVENTKFMADALIKANELNLKVVSHCEDLFLAGKGIINEGEVSKKLDVEGIPNSSEDVATAREIALAQAYNVPIHICHVSSKTSVDIIRRAKNSGVKVTCETAPHYFTFTDEMLLSKNANFRMNPPLRTLEDKMAIIEGLVDGTIDAIATDHAPHTVEEKSDFLTAPNGVIGMETSFAVSYTMLVKTGILTLEKLFEKMSLNPAEILGINAGVLKEGAVADIALIDLNEKFVVDTQKLHGKSQNTPFENMALYGKVKYTILNGNIVFKDN